MYVNPYPLIENYSMMSIVKTGLSTLLICLLFSCAQMVAQSSTVKTKESIQDIDIYLLMGQSNMAGRGGLTEEYLAMKHERVLMLDKENKWIPARHPVHFDKPQSIGVGPGLSFGIEMAKAYPKKTIGLVPCAVGGTPISKWEPGAYHENTKTHPYDDAVIRIKEAQKKGVVKGVIWLQGEGDSNPQPAQKYVERITKLIDRLRKEVGDPQLPFVAGELGRYKDKFQLFNENLALLPQHVPYTLTVSSEGLKDKGDTLHFDSPSATEYGKRFAQGMLLLQKKK